MYVTVQAAYPNVVWPDRSVISTEAQGLYQVLLANSEERPTNVKIRMKLRKNTMPHDICKFTAGGDGPYFSLCWPLHIAKAGWSPHNLLRMAIHLQLKRSRDAKGQLIEIQTTLRLVRPMTLMKKRDGTA